MHRPPNQRPGKTTPAPMHSTQAGHLQTNPQASHTRHWLLAGLSALALFVATAWWPDTPDGWIHLQRVRALAEALQMGVLYPRIFPDFAFGYGYPVLNFYAPAFYYPPAILHALGMEVLAAVRLSLALGFGASAIGMLLLLERRVGAWAAVAATLAFLVFPYRLYDLFIRGALPEFAAFLWLPWLGWAGMGLVDTLWHKRAHAGRWVVACALLWAALLLTHNLTALLAGLAGAGIVATLVVVALRRGEGRRTGAPLLWSLFAAVTGTLLAAWYWAPALAEAQWVGIGVEETSGYLNHFATWATLFSWSVPFHYPAAAEAVVPLPGIVAVLGLGVGALLLVRSSLPRRLALVTLLSLGAAVFLTTAASAPLWQGLAPVLSRLQFPWRWQTIVALAAALALGLLVEWTVRGRAQRQTKLIAGAVALGILFLYVGGLRWNVLPEPARDFSAADMLRFDAEMGQVGASWTAEFLPRWVTEQRWAIGREPSDSEGALPAAALDPATSLRLVRAEYLRAEYAVASPVAWEAIFHRFYFPAWTVQADAERLAATPVTNLGLVRAEVPASAAQIALDWRATPALWWGRVLFLAGWLALLWAIWRGWRSPLAVALWCGVLAMAVVTATGVTARALPVQSIEADYGTVQLAGVVAPPARRGSVAEITLHWLVRTAQPNLTVFVHLLDASGAVVAQHDAPLGGLYTPAGRLLAGMIVDATYPLVLPQELPAGTYDVRIGLYATGMPDAPMAPLGADAPFATGAQLEVHQ